MRKFFLPLIACALLTGVCACGPQTAAEEEAQVVQNDSNTPLHLLQPDYKIPYGVPAKEDVKAGNAGRMSLVILFACFTEPYRNGGISP